MNTVGQNGASFSIGDLFSMKKGDLVQMTDKANKQYAEQYLKFRVYSDVVNVTPARVEHKLYGKLMILIEYGFPCCKVFVQDTGEYVDIFTREICKVITLDDLEKDSRK